MRFFDAGKKRYLQEILEYLRKHPEASDTLEGIAEWWLLNQRIPTRCKESKQPF